MRDPATPRVFLSYSRTDSLEFARRLHDLLEGEGLSLYRDLSDLEGGEDWWRQVEEAIRTVEHVVLVLHRTLRLWDLDTGDELARLTFDTTPTAVAVCSHERLVVGDARGRIHVIQIIE